MTRRHRQEISYSKYKIKRKYTFRGGSGGSLLPFTGDLKKT
jgi:hypothetical protein